MKKYKMLLLLVICPVLINAQIGSLFSKVKNKVTQRVDSKVDKAIDKTLDEAEGKSAESSTTTASDENHSVNKPEANSSARFHSKYDFVPGTEILYYDNFEQEAIAELPASWNTNGSGEVVTSEKYPGKWLQMHTAFMYLSGNTKAYASNYTIEFDIILQLKNNGWMYPTFTCGLFSTGGSPGTDNQFLKEYKMNAALSATIYPQENSGSKVVLESYSDNKPFFSSEPKSYGDLDKYYGKIIHVSMQIQKQRLRMWINDAKVFDVPKGIDTSHQMNQLFFKVGQTNYKEDQYAIYVSNIKVATGISDTRHKLIDEGKFSTTGILFEVNSADIKEASYGTLKEIATVLKENPSVHIIITGYTSSDGDEKANLALSKNRADAVKAMLVKNFSISADMLDTDGKGETQPVADNKTKEGKAANRRVEFTKGPNP